MTSQLNVDTIVDKAGSGGTNVKVANTSTYVSDGGAVTQNIVQAIVKAWANFDESGTPSIRDNFNVSSLTDNGTGYFTVTLTNTMSNDDYVRIGSAGENQNAGGNRVLGLRVPSAGSFNIITKNTSGNDSDTQDTCIAVLGDLA